jgi:hypothetical protein
MFFIGGCFVEEDVLYRRTFCIYGRFVEGRFVEEDVLYRRTFCIGGRFVERTFCRGGCYVEGRFVDGRLVEGRFVEGRFVLVPTFLNQHPIFYICTSRWKGHCYNFRTHKARKKNSS